MLLRKDRGFTLIELLIVVATIGVIAAIAIPNLLNAIDRGRQKRTMADMRSVGTAVEAYSVDFNSYPNTGAMGTIDATVDTHIEPTYIKQAPRRDGWGHDLRYASTGGQFYTVQAACKDNSLEGSPSGGATTSFNSDIVFVNGSFTQFPEGRQQ